MALSQQFLDARNRTYRRYFIEDSDLSHRMNILIGARGIGKTTTLVQHLLDYAQGDLHSKKILYLQADHFLMASSTLYELSEQFVLHGGQYIAIDEIHKYPNWSLEIKSIYDTFEQLKIFASGSSALEIHKGTHDLSRRGLVFHMQGLSFRECLALEKKMTLPHITLHDIINNHEKISHEIITKLKETNHRILPCFSDYTSFGYYPYALDLNQTHYAMALEQNIHTTLETDLAAIYPQLTGNSIRKIKQLLTFIASAVPFTPNWNKIKSIIDVGDMRTLKNYFKYLEDSGLIQSLRKSSKKLNALEGTEKIYLDNPNLLSVLSNTSANKGSLRETFFLTMLKKDHHASAPLRGDFLIDDQYVFELGGRNIDFSQLKGLDNAFVVADDIEQGHGRTIPLWLFGFLY